MNAQPFGAPQNVIDLGHAQVPHWQIGQGPDLLFVHGWPMTHATWRDLVPRLRDDFTCHLIDLPGAGESAWRDNKRLNIVDLSSDVAQVARHVAPSRPVGLLGYDSGGGIARLAAQELGDKVSGLTLGNTEIPGHHTLKLKALLASARLPGAALSFRMGLSMRWFRMVLLKDAYAEVARVEREFTPLYLRPLIDNRRRLEGAMALAQNASPAEFDKVEGAHRAVTAPTALVWGQDDVWFPVEACRAMLDQFAGPVTLDEVEGGKLLVHEEHGARFAAAARRVFGGGAAQAA